MFTKYQTKFCYNYAIPSFTLEETLRALLDAPGMHCWKGNSHDFFKTPPTLYIYLYLLEAVPSR